MADTGTPVVVAGGMKALQAEREKNRRLRRELHNLRATVIEATNHMVDVVENAGGQRNEF